MQQRAMGSRIAELEQEIEIAQREADEYDRKAAAARARSVSAEAALALERGKLARTTAFHASGGSLLMGDGVTDDTLLHIAHFLPTAKDLLRLQLTNRRFSSKAIAAPPSVSSGGGGGAAPEMLCIPDEAARRRVAGCSEQERGWVSYRTTESWLCPMHEVAVLRLPLAFGRAHADIMLSENGAVATKNVGGNYRAAASTVVMWSGRHYAQFTVVEGDPIFGVIRPGWDVEGGEVAEEVDGHCFYSTFDGRRWPGNHAWEGMQGAREPGDRIGMLLDLDQGSMTVWKNDELLGVMVAEGLTGPLCWAASMGDEGDSARIESAPATPSSTEEELAAAKAWQEAHPPE